MEREPTKDRVRKWITRWDALKELRDGFDTNYNKPLQEWVLPRHGFFSDIEDKTSQGRKRGSKILNNHAQRAHQILAAGMHGGLTSPFRRWFDLSIDDESLNKLGRVVDHLEERKKIYYRLFSSSNFYAEVHKFHKEISGPGTACMLVDEDPDTVVRFKNLTFGQYWLAENHRGVVDTCYREIDITAEQILDKFGDNGDVPQSITEEVRNNRHEERHKVLHIVQPRRERDGRRADSKNMPWESIHLLLEAGGLKDSKDKSSNKHILRESGYQQFPFVIGRWSVLGDEVYGRAPGHDVLPDAKQLQRMESDYSMLVEKSAKPPMRKPSDMKEPINDLPGGITKYDPTHGADVIGKLYDLSIDAGILAQKMKDLEWDIDKAFFNDLFLLSMGQNYGQPPTAEEIGERRQEKLILLGPTVEKMDSESVPALFERVDFLASEAGIIPDPPRELWGAQMRVVLIGALAQAQRAAKTNNLRAVTSFCAELSASTAEVIDNLDTDETLRQFADSVGASGVMRDPEEVERTRQKRAEDMARARQAQETQEALAAAGQAASAAKTIGDTDPETLNQLTEAVGGGF